jgi:D-3-phosphoglycerate dehydrogenase / 2-oxoglutarate reductase
MRVLGFDPFLSPERAAELGIELVDSVRGMLPEVDYLTVHTPLTDETRHLVGMKELEILKPGVRLINCARGGIYDEAALAEGLKRGVIGGVALDVFEKEPCTDSPLFDMPGVLVTPHLGASTEEAQSQVAVEGVGLLVDFLDRRDPPLRQLESAIDPAALEGVRGFLDLAWRLGLLLSQLDDRPAAVVLDRLPGRDRRPEHAARDRRLRGRPARIGDRRRQHRQRRDAPPGAGHRTGRAEPHRSRVRSVRWWPSISWPGISVHRAAGTLFGHAMPRLVQLEGHGSRPTSTASCSSSRIRTCPASSAGSARHSASSGVNIAQMTVGRSTPGGDAIGVLNLDQEPSAQRRGGRGGLPGHPLGQGGADASGWVSSPTGWPCRPRRAVAPGSDLPRAAGV